MQIQLSAEEHEALIKCFTDGYSAAEAQEHMKQLFSRVLPLSFLIKFKADHSEQISERRRELEQTAQEELSPTGLLRYALIMLRKAVSMMQMVNTPRQLSELVSVFRLCLDIYAEHRKILLEERTEDERLRDAVRELYEELKRNEPVLNKAQEVGLLSRFVSLEAVMEDAHSKKHES